MTEPETDRSDELIAVGMELTRAQISDYVRWSLDQKFPPGHPALPVQVELSVVAVRNPASTHPPWQVIFHQASDAYRDPWQRSPR